MEGKIKEKYEKYMKSINILRTTLTLRENVIENINAGIYVNVYIFNHHRSEYFFHINITCEKCKRELQKKSCWVEYTLRDKKIEG